MSDPWPELIERWRSHDLPAILGQGNWGLWHDSSSGFRAAQRDPIDQVLFRVSTRFDVTAADIVSHLRTEPVLTARRLCYLICTDLLTDIPRAHLAKRLGGRDPNTLRVVTRRARARLESDPDFLALYQDLKAELAFVLQPKRSLTGKPIEDSRLVKGFAKS